MDEPRRHVKWNKSGAEIPILHDLAHRWSKKSWITKLIAEWALPEAGCWRNGEEEKGRCQSFGVELLLARKGTSWCPCSLLALSPLAFAFHCMVVFRCCSCSRQEEDKETKHVTESVSFEDFPWKQGLFINNLCLAFFIIGDYLFLILPFLSNLCFISPCLQLTWEEVGKFLIFFRTHCHPKQDRATMRWGKNKFWVGSQESLPWPLNMCITSKMYHSGLYLKH